MTFSDHDLLAYIRANRLGTVCTLGPTGEPQAAYVGLGATEALEIVFDTASTSRKHANLLRDPRAAVTIGGPGEQTLQYEGLAELVPPGGDGDAVREAYFLSWPDGRGRLSWPGLVHWRIRPTWARFTDYDRGPLVQTFFERAATQVP